MLNIYRAFKWLDEIQYGVMACKTDSAALDRFDMEISRIKQHGYMEYCGGYIVVTLERKGMLKRYSRSTTLYFIDEVLFISGNRAWKRHFL